MSSFFLRFRKELNFVSCSFLFGNGILFGYAASFEQEGDKVKVSRGLFVQQLVAAFGFVVAYRSGVLNSDNGVVLLAFAGLFLNVSAFMAFNSAKQADDGSKSAPSTPAVPKIRAKAASPQANPAAKSPRTATPKAPKSPRTATSKAPKSPRGTPKAKATEAATPKTPRGRRTDW